MFDTVWKWFFSRREKKKQKVDAEEEEEKASDHRPLYDEVNAARIAEAITAKMTSMVSVPHDGAPPRKLFEKASVYIHREDEGCIDVKWDVNSASIPWSPVVNRAVGTSLFSRGVVSIQSQQQQLVIRVKKAKLPSTKQMLLTELLKMGATLFWLRVLQSAVLAVPSWMCRLQQQ